MRKLNLKSEAGFTMADLIAALIIFSIFTGVIGSLMYTSYKTNLQTKVAGIAGGYAIQILEDIDKIGYDEVVNGMENAYKDKFGIPSQFNIHIEVSNYNDDENSKEDLIKKVKLTIEYTFAESSDRFVVNRLKIKEV